MVFKILVKKKGNIMSFKLIVDSCCELPEKYKDDPRIEVIPFIMDVGERQVIDDENFNQ